MNIGYEEKFDPTFSHGNEERELLSLAQNPAQGQGQTVPAPPPHIPGYQIGPQIPPATVEASTLALLAARGFNRPVLTTKRAAQNRNAQRAFRQRKEKYIKELESKAAETEVLKQQIEELKAENMQLRDYTLALQLRVIELGLSNGVSVGEAHQSVPPPPLIFNRMPEK